MKKNLVFAFLAGVSLCLGLLEAGETLGAGSDPRMYRVPRLSEPIKIDGNWDKLAWQKIPPLVINQPVAINPQVGKDSGHRPNVLAKLAWDDQSLYLANQTVLCGR